MYVDKFGNKLQIDDRIIIPSCTNYKEYIIYKIKRSVMFIDEVYVYAKDVVNNENIIIFASDVQKVGQNMKTSYFANFRKLDKNKYIAVSIARITPVGFDIKVEEFAPEKSTLFNYKNGKINEEQYTKEYWELLFKKLIILSKASG